MAGGKETPRQKMIGMMYLVLTALLALNVSKQILDAFVAIEVARLKKYIEINNNIPLKTFAPFSANPTKGYLLMPEDVSLLLSSELYDKEKK